MREGEGAGEEGRGGERRGEGRGFGDRNPFLFVVSRAFARVFPVFLAYSGHIEAAGYHFSPPAKAQEGRKRGEERRGEERERRGERETIRPLQLMRPLCVGFPSVSAGFTGQQGNVGVHSMFVVLVIRTCMHACGVAWRCLPCSCTSYSLPPSQPQREEERGEGAGRGGGGGGCFRVRSWYVDGYEDCVLM